MGLYLPRVKKWRRHYIIVFLLVSAYLWWILTSHEHSGFHKNSSLELSASTVTKRSATIITFKVHLKAEQCSLLHMTRSNISAAAGASDSNSVPSAPTIKCFWQYLTFYIYNVLRCALASTPPGMPGTHPHQYFSWGTSMAISPQYYYVAYFRI